METDSHIGLDGQLESKLDEFGNVGVAVIEGEMPQHDGQPRLRFANGAHNPSLLRRADGTVEELDADGMALGMVEGWPYEEGTRTLARGDLVVLYTDGVTEARNRGGELFGEDRLHALVAGFDGVGASAAARAIVAAANDFTEGQGPQDDLTVLVLEVTG